jgi:hypothetical protein
VKRLALLALVLAACSGTPSPPTTPSPASTGSTAATPVAATDAGRTNDGAGQSKETRAVARTLEKVSKIRGLESTRVVPGEKLERTDLVARVKDKALREYPPEALRREGQLIQLMGFAPATFDYLGEMMKLLEAQLEGFYEPNNGTMYLAADLKGEQAKATLAHELVHALQDQHWDLKSRSSYKPGEGDKSLALAAIAEGDATSAMLDFMMLPSRTALDLPDDMLRELMKSGIAVGDVQSVPHILKTTLIAPYVEGVAFIHALRRRGGWDAVNAAWAKLPTTTEQILHLDKFDLQEPAIDVPAPSGSTLGAGWKKDDEDTFGELDLALTFGEWMEADEGRAAVAGWGGDRSAVYTKGDEIALALHIKMDGAQKAPSPGAYADRLFTKVSAGLKKHLGKTQADAPGTICIERKDTGPLLFAKKDRDVVMIAGPAKVGKDAWKSTSSCAAARKWADEVLAQK